MRASDIGQWAFCRRAWWLANVQKVEHGNPEVLQHGNERHDAHGRRVLAAMRMQRIALLLLAVALLAALILVLIQLSAG